MNNEEPEKEKKLIINYKNVDLAINDHRILSDISLEIEPGEFIYLIGAVGSGKSTFLKSLYHEIPIKRGQAFVFDFNLLKMKTRQIPNLRRRIGIVFQDFQLLMDRNVQKNLEFVLKATGWKNKGKINKRIDEVLEQTKMQTKSYKFPHELSGGEQQRVSIARALLNSAELILADEPTGNLDPETGNSILELLHDISKQGTVVIMSTHNYNMVKKYPGKILKCADERLKNIDPDQL